MSSANEKEVTEIKKPIVINEKDEVSEPEAKWIFKSKAHFFAACAGLGPFFPAVELFLVENPQIAMLIVYAIAALVRRVSHGKVYLLPKLEDIKKASFIIILAITLIIIIKIK